MQNKAPVLLFAALSLFSLPKEGSAQSMGKRIVNLDLQISYRMPKKLLRIPLNSAGVHPIFKDRWEYVSKKKKSRGKSGSKSKKRPKREKDPVPDLDWGIHVLAFAVPKLETPTTPVAGSGAGQKREPTKKPPKAPAKKGEKENPRVRFQPFRSFDDFLKKTGKDLQFVERGVERRQSTRWRLPYRYFAWSKGLRQYRCAVYKKDGKEIALYGYFIRYSGELTRKARKAYRKQTKEREKALRKGIESLVWERGREYKEQGVRGERRFAHSDLRKKILEAEKKSIAGYSDWNLFCTENFIIKYSFDKGKGKREDAHRFSERMAKQMGDMILQYRKYFPPHDKMTRWWSVLRICRSHEEFSKYGSTKRGVIGWFNPLSKELVIFRSKRWSEAVAYHEGWHQYAHFWFAGKVRLHRWYDEGLGDFFGAMERKSNRRFGLRSSIMRLATIKKLVKDGKTVPLKDIVNWNKKRFYGPKAGLYYAQGWAIVDFLMRGKDSEQWKSIYAKILPTYTKVCLATMDQKKAVEAAFKGVDWAVFEKDWKDYVRAMR